MTPFWEYPAGRQRVLCPGTRRGNTQGFRADYDICEGTTCRKSAAGIAETLARSLSLTAIPMLPRCGWTDNHVGPHEPLTAVPGKWGHTCRGCRPESLFQGQGLLWPQAGMGRMKLRCMHFL